MNFKNIHIGSLINQQVIESELEINRICRFFKYSEKDIVKMYNSKSLDTEMLLRWSKLLEYDFFRIYTQHIILYSPSKNNQTVPKRKKTSLPQFRKNIYTREIIDFILELIDTGEKTRLQIINEYRIPKTTLYKWIEKYKK